LTVAQATRTTPVSESSEQQAENTVQAAVAEDPINLVKEFRPIPPLAESNSESEIDSQSEAFSRPRYQSEDWQLNNYSLGKSLMRFRTTTR